MRMQVRLVVASLAALALVGLGLGAAPAQAAGLNLHVGSRGTVVKTLETRLARLALLPRSSVDRRYRASTARAVRRFQGGHGLPATGRVNRATWNSIGSAYARAVAPPVWQRPSWVAPKVTAHRGGSKEAPENTLASVRHGVAVAADAVEFDLRTTSDGVPVLMHDDSLTRTTNCDGYSVSQVTYGWLSTNCWVGGTAERVPTFEQVAVYLADVAAVDVLPELKEQGPALTDSELASIMKSIKDHGLATRTYMQSFFTANLPRVKALDDQVRTVYLSNQVIPVYESAEVPGGPISMERTGADIASVNMTALTRRNIDTYHDPARFIPIYTWTANTTTELQHAWALGVDSVGTDIPTAALQLYR